MRRVAALLVLALLGGCANGGGSAPAPSPTAPASAGLADVRDTLVLATGTEVHALPRDGAPRLLARAPGEVNDLEVSRDGRYVAAVAVTERLTVTVHDLTAGRTATWTAPDDTLMATSIGRYRDGFVMVSEGSDNSLLTFDPATVLAGGGPARTAFRGVTSARLVATDADTVLVATGEEASARGGPETVHEVAADGSTKRLFGDGEGLPEGEVRNLPIGAAALTADGRRVVYATGTAAGECEYGFTVVVRDLTTGREIATKVPHLGDDVLTVADTVTTGADGRTVVGFTTEAGGCVQPERAAAYALDGTAWKQVANGATWAARGPGGRIATLTNAGVLTVAGRVIKGGVALAVWSPV